MAWERVNGPLGAVRADYHAAQIAAAIYNAAKGKKGRQVKITDLIIKWDRAAPRHEPMDPHQMLRTLRRINSAMGGRELTDPGEVTGDGHARRPRRQDRGGHQRRGEGPGRAG